MKELILDAIKNQGFEEEMEIKSIERIGNADTFDGRVITYKVVVEHNINIFDEMESTYDVYFYADTLEILAFYA